MESKEEIQILCRHLFKIDEKLKFYYARMLDNERHLIEALEKERESIKAKIKELHPKRAADYKDTSTPEEITESWAEVEEYIR